MASPVKQTNAKLNHTGSAVVAWGGRFAGPLLALAVYYLLPEGKNQLSDPARATAAIGTLMAVWWMTEALPLPATSLLPLILFPLARVFPDAATGAQIEQAAAPYANPFIFLFMGGFMIAQAIERWNLHRRIALLTVLTVGTRPARMIAGFMIATAMLSMWISNTATTVMMLPIGLSVITLLTDRFCRPAQQILQGVRREGQFEADDLSGFAVCLMLGIAYAASIGGVGTLVGTPPNVFFAGFMLEQYQITLGFGRWMCLGLPLVVIFLLIAWFILTKVVFPIRISQIPGGRRLIHEELNKLGPMSRGEWTVLVVFLLTACGWILRGPVTSWLWLRERVPAITELNDAMIALAGALVLFVIPVDAKRSQFALDWPTARKLPWGMLLLFGGGLCLASAVTGSGLDQWIGNLMKAWYGLPSVVLVLLVTAVVIFLTELTSNIATATTFLPILGGVAVGIGAEPLLLLAPAALAASCAFMLPVATPPNAIVFGSGHITIGQMIKAGLWLNLIGIILIPLLMYILGAWMLGVNF
ncbi:MAG: anion transporter [Phycisphaerae bacterium SM23_30]|nr:MAG: anion transporter [Phycisphaerae bacterium SM23_30]